MCEERAKVKIEDLVNVQSTVLDVANVGIVKASVEEGEFMFAGETLGKKDLVLLWIDVDPESGEGELSVHCASMVFATQFAKVWKEIFA